jgi:uroporphyrinogen III methyltransferase/synthase
VTGTLESIAGLVEAHQIPSPVVSVIGEVVKLRERLNWFEQRPLFGRRIVVTQRSDLAGPLVLALEEKGAEVFHIPGTRWGPHPDQARLDKALAELDTYDWILFSNPIGIDLFFQRLLQGHGDLRKLGPARLGAYGPLSGEKLRQWHLQPAAVSADHKTPLILESITRCGKVQGQRFLVLRGEEAREEVPEALERLGARVDAVPCYEVAPETEDPSGLCPIFLNEGADWITFASGLAIEHFHARFNLPKLLERFPNTRLAIASPTIQWALEKLGLRGAVVVARPNDVPSLVEGILKADSRSELFTAA